MFTNQELALLDAIEQGDTDKAKQCIENGADVNAKGCIGNLCDRTPLHEAVFKRNPAMVALLMECGADVNAQDSQGRTALHWAAYGNDHVCVPILAEKAGLSLRDHRGCTALHYAAESTLPAAAIRRLIERGADVNATDNLGATPLDRARGRRRQEAADTLMAAGGQRRLAGQQWESRIDTSASASSGVREP